MIRALPVDPIINKMKENVRQMIRCKRLNKRSDRKYILWSKVAGNIYFGVK
jgi:hypothetical protein